MGVTNMTQRVAKIQCPTSRQTESIYTQLEGHYPTLLGAELYPWLHNRPGGRTTPDTPSSRIEVFAVRDRRLGNWAKHVDMFDITFFI